MSNNSAKQQELKHIASIVRALITSRKPPCYLRDVLREYPEVESKPLPFKTMGYRSPQELLEDTGEFLFAGYGHGDIIITAKYSKSSAHIASMVRSQKSGKPSRIVPLKVAPKKAPTRLPTTTRYNDFAGDRNNNSSYNNNSYGQNRNQQLQRQKSMSSSSNQQPKDLREMLNSKKQQNPAQQQQQQVRQQQQQQQQNNTENSKQESNQSQKQSSPRPILGASGASASSTKSASNTKSATANTKNNSSISSNASTKSEAACKAQNSQVMSQNAAGQKLQQRLKNIQNNTVVAQQQQQQTQQKQEPVQTAAKDKPATKPAASKNEQQQQQQTQTQQRQQQSQPQQRQQQQQPQQKQQQHKPSTETNNMQQQPQKRIHQQEQPLYTPPAVDIQNRLRMMKNDFEQQPRKSFTQYNNYKMDAVQTLVNYCQTKRFSPPQFNILKSKYPKVTFSCRVQINDTIFSTYPDEYDNEYMAKEACAKRALQRLQAQDMKKPLPACTFTDMELLDKLYNELLTHPHGIFAKNMPEWFETKYGQSLPDNWWALIQTSSLFTTESELNKVIIFANKDVDKDMMLMSLGGEQQTKTIQIDAMRLPWADEFWEILVTHCESTVKIWVRLFGTDYDVRFAALMNDIEVYMGAKKERPVSIIRDYIYLVFTSDCWHRVRLQQLDKTKGTAECFFIDFGESDWLTVDQLYICETHFLKLPAQAVPLHLYGLEDFEGHPYARKCLDEILLGKSVVGKIFTKEAEFDPLQEENAKISVVLFDTSSQVDINLNHELMNAICAETVAPEIKKKTVTNVVVTHVCDNGDIYLNVSPDDFKYMQFILQKIVASKFRKDQHKVTLADLKRSNLFLICDDTDENNLKWHRVCIVDSLASIQSDTESLQTFYVDCGVTKETHISKIFLLESLSMALSKFPPQAIKVRLHNIPEITSNTVARLRGLLPANCDALVRLVEPLAVPYVIIYTRLESPGTLCTINDVIRVEQELEACFDQAQGPDDSSSANRPSSFDFSKKSSSNASGSNLSSPTTPTINVFKGLTLATMPNSPQKSSDLPKLKNYENIPAVGEYFEVKVTMSGTPSNFTILPYKDYPQLRTLMKELQDVCENNDEFIPLDMVEVGQAYAAKNRDSFFHRVTVLKKCGEIIHVLYCDFGDIDTVNSSRLKTLPFKFRQLPKLAVQSRLYGIKAACGDWTLEDCEFFRKLTMGQSFVSIIKALAYEKKENNSPTLILELELIDVSTDEDVFIHELLLKEKRAIPV